MEGKGHSKLPPGFRFHPTDEELIMYYLRNQATSRPCPVPIIPEVDIYKFDPWELPEKAEFGEKEWYFFSPRDRKYPNGVRPNRATVSGYWKATGTDKAILSGSRYVGVKKALVFYNGRPPKGIKTDWIMHEYRLGDSGRRPNKLAGSMRLDDWVLCRIYKKRHSESVVEQKEDDALPMLMPMPTTPTPPMPIPTLISPEVMEQSLMLPRTCSLAHLLEVEEYLSLSNLLSDNPVGLSTEFETTGNMTDMDKFRSGDTSYQSGNPTKFQVNQSSLFNHPIFVNSVFEFQ